MKPFDRPARIPWPPILVLACFLSAYFLSSALPLPSGISLPVWVNWIGGGLILFGICLDAYCAAYLLRAKTAVLPNQAATHLVSDGPFKISRNPIYVGYLIILVGAALFFASVWFLLSAIVYCLLITHLSIKPEEAHLSARFGDQWHRYQTQTPRWVGPF